MPVKINCPTCNASLNMPDSMYGKAVRCPSCRNPFQCPQGPTAAPAPRPTPARAASAGSPFDFDAPEAAPAVTAADPYYGGEAYTPRRPRYGTGWPAVSGGTFWFFLFAFAAFIPGAFDFIATVSEMRVSSLGAVRAIFIFLMLVQLSAMVFLMLGLLRTRHAPPQTTARSIGFTAAILSIVGLGALFLADIFRLIVLFGDPMSGGPGPGVMKTLGVFQLLETATLVAAVILLLLFFLVAGAELRSRGLVYGVVYLAVLIAVSAVVLQELSKTPGRMDNPMEGQGLGPLKRETRVILTFFIQTTVLVWFSILLIGLVKAIRRAPRQQAG